MAARKRAIMADIPTGAAHLRWPAGAKVEGLLSGRPTTIFVLMRQTFKTDQRTGWSEHGQSLFCYVANAGEPPRQVEGKEKQVLIRTLTNAIVRLKPDENASFTATLKNTEDELCNSLRRPTESELGDGIRHAVAPIFACIISN